MAREAFSYRRDAAVPPFPGDRAVVVFDGDCPLCSRSARVVLTRDRRGRFRVLSAQTPLGQALYAHYGLSGDDLQTLLLIQDGRLFQRSEAVIRIARGLGGGGRLAGLLRLIPAPWRDRGYDWVACNRLRIVKAQPVCLLPTAFDPDRILG